MPEKRPEVFIAGRLGMASKWSQAFERRGASPRGVFVFPGALSTFSTVPANFHVTNQPIQELNKLLKVANSPIVILADYPRILRDEEILAGVDYLNLHNGDISEYRGIGEVCVLDAVARQKLNYGATLHLVLPRQEVDAGPVLIRNLVEFDSPQTFSQMMTASLRNLNNIIGQSVELVLSGSLSASEVSLGSIFSYSDVPEIISKADSLGTRFFTRNLGVYARIFPRIADEVSKQIPQ